MKIQKKGKRIGIIESNSLFPQDTKNHFEILGNETCEVKHWLRTYRKLLLISNELLNFFPKESFLEGDYAILLNNVKNFELRVFRDQNPTSGKVSKERLNLNSFRLKSAIILGIKINGKKRPTTYFFTKGDRPIYVDTQLIHRAFTIDRNLISQEDVKRLFSRPEWFLEVGWEQRNQKPM